MKLYNTRTRKKEMLPKTSGQPLRLFVCGPTVYDSLHIGNARVYVMFDVLVRYLRSQKKQVVYLQNITDIDDKIIARAKEKNISPKEIASTYTKLYLQHMKALGIDSVDTYAKATDYIPHIKKQIEGLIAKKHAYKIENDGWYFDLKTFPAYGKLSRRTVEQAEDGTSRIDASVHKRNRGDFCLWKFSRIGEPIWKARFGDGRPGWHIEDTAISESKFGSQYELHGGGRDLMFPHHEAEIAQQEALSGKKPCVRIWMHIGILTLQGKKMSKSLSNFITIEQFLSLFSPDIFRFFVLGNHYRSSLDYSETQVKAAQASLISLKELITKLRFRLQVKKRTQLSKKINISNDLKQLSTKFKEAMEDDLHTPRALAIMFETINKVNPNLWKLSASDAKRFHNLLLNQLEILGITIKTSSTPLSIRSLVKEREGFRRNKQFMHADVLRKRINALGYSIEDTPFGPLALPRSEFSIKP
jgi:cysteinyl-tRNA synthetase